MKWTSTESQQQRMSRVGTGQESFRHPHAQPRDGHSEVLEELLRGPLNYIRKHLTYWVFLTSDDARPHTTYRTVWNEMRRLVSDMPRNTTEHLGPYKEDGKWTNRSMTVKGSARSKLLYAIRFFGETIYNLNKSSRQGLAMVWPSFRVCPATAGR